MVQLSCCRSLANGTRAIWESEKGHRGNMVRINVGFGHGDDPLSKIFLLECGTRRRMN